MTASPDNSRTLIVGAVVALVVIVGIGALLYLAAPSVSDRPDPVVQAPGEGEPTPPPRTEEDPPAVTRRIPVPRPQRTAPVEVEEDVPDEPSADTEDSDTLDSDFPRIQGAGEALGRALTRALGDVQPELIACLAGWHQAQPEVFVGRVVFGLGMDRDGMHTIDILDVEDVPEQTLTCLGDVLWDEVEWPAVEQPLEVSWPIQVSVREDDGAELPEEPAP